MRGPIAFALVVAASACAQSPQGSGVAAPPAGDRLTPTGSAPTYTARALSSVPNAQALRGHFWVPGLDEGYVPQGVAFGDGALWIATYRSTDPAQDRGPCRVFRVDPAGGATGGHFDLPPDCGHAGGTAWGGDGTLYVADTHVLFRVRVAEALHAGRCTPASCQSLQLGGAITGHFLALHKGELWIGEYTRALDGPGRLWRIPLATVDALLASGGVLDQNSARATLPVAAQSQGAAIAADGALWLTQSGGTLGRLQRVDAQTGRVLAEYAMPAGIEDIEFAPDGTLWAASEAGARRWNRWETFFPLVFAIDTAALR
ncbi:MAG: hypothetical protein ABI537_15395 [Casimicrobiaceae bacterium]